MSRSIPMVAVRGASLILWIAGVVFSGVSCRDDNIEGPTDPSTTADAGPALAGAATAALSFYQVSAGFYHTCGVTTDNRAYCWGYNGDGELGNGTPDVRVRPTAVAGGLQFRAISAGDYHHTCGLTMDYRAYCWGGNWYGEVGDGTTTDRPLPVRVGGGLIFSQVSAGRFHTCGVVTTTHRAYCWGDDSYGQLGDGGTSYYQLSPVPVAGTLQFRQISAGNSYTCGVTTTYRTYCWGDDNFGQLGDGTNVTARLTPTLVAGGHLFTQVDAGFRHTCAVTTDFRAFCWGNGRGGEIGDGKKYLRFTPSAVAGGLSFERVSAGYYHSCGETTLNRAYCWGWNTSGALGTGTTSPRVTPVAVAGGLFFSQLSAGNEYTCGRTAEAKAYCWGDNMFGRLGDGTTTNRLRPVPVAGPM